MAGKSTLEKMKEKKKEEEKERQDLEKAQKELIAKIVGFAMIEEAEENPSFIDKFEEIIQARVKKKSDREVMGMKPLPKKKKTSETASTT